MARNRWTHMLLVLLAVFGLSVTTSCGDSESGGDGVGTAFQPATVPSGFTDEVVASGITNPTAMAFAPDGRIFVCQQGGALRVIKNGALLSTPFLNVTVNSAGERGLLGVAFDPSFATNNFVYVYYTATTPAIHNRLSRFTANGDVAVGGSETILLELNNLSSATNHNGGALHFGNDGKLYVAVGENATGSNAQTLSNLLGKMLRLNANGTIPSDNPFFGTATGNNRAIWALGLRNPFTFSVQRTTGRMFINDVGQASWEEINDGIAGSNYGWPTTEGMTTNPSFRSPLFAYSSAGTATECAITGGAFYNPVTTQFPANYVGKYFFADFCAGWIRWLDPAAPGSANGFATNLSSPVDLVVSNDGALYYLARGNGGQVGRIRFTSQPPQITTHPANRTVSVGQSATFTVSATGSQPLAYQWQRGGTNISGATSPSYTLPSATMADNGATFRVVVSNAFGTVTSNNATLTVTANSPPTATITAPAAGTLYSGGNTINYAGTGTDPEQGTLPGSAFTWRVDFHHDTHFHPHMADTTGTSGSFTIPTLGETSANVWFRIHLTVRDSAGLTHSVFRDVNPRTSVITLASNPTGLQLRLDGQPTTAPSQVTSVEGIVRSLDVVSPQTLNGTTYTFSSWSDGGAASHTISTPTADTTYTATFTASTSGGGLSGEYFDNINLTNLLVTRVDPTVNFNWGSGSPAPGIGADTFSVRWTGTVTPQFTQTYTFYTTSDDGVRLWVNGVQVINNWTDHPPTENSGTIALTAGQPYSILMEMYENGGGATATLSWSSSSQPKQIIPSSRLNPAPLLVFPVRVNFQLAGAPIPSGYTPDTGQLFGSRGSGLTFGWNTDHTDVTRDRNINADQRLDTLCHFHAGGQWEIALPNGSYSVLVSVGDAGFSSTHTLIAEGVNAFNAVTLAANVFQSATRTVTVSDGRLTLTQGSAVDKATRINYVEITRL